MMRRPFFFLLVAASVALVAGCAEEKPQSNTPAANAGGGANQHAEDDKIHANLEKLSAADHTAAEAQGVCPMTGKKLGEMGVPIKVTVKDGDKDVDVWVCCEKCKDPVTNDPAAALAKLKK